MKEKLQAISPGVWNEAGALGMFQMLISSWGDTALKKLIMIKDSKGNVAQVPMWKVYNKNAATFEEAFYTNNGSRDHSLTRKRMENIDDRFWLPGNQIAIAAEILLRKTSQRGSRKRLQYQYWNTKI